MADSNYYDLVDTLINVPGSNGLGGYMRGLPSATPKYRPTGSFTIVTSQPPHAEKEVKALVAKLFPGCSGLHIVAGTSGKIAKLKQLGATNYTDNDPSVRNALAKAIPGIKLFKTVSGSRVVA